MNNNNNVRELITRLDKPVLLRCWLPGLLFLLSFNTAALGEEPAERGTVLTRTRPELGALGVKVGGFRVYPDFTYKLMHDDNIFATQNNKQSSYISEYSLEMPFLSNWPNHELNLLARADIRRHSDYPSENTEDWEFSANGRLDISRDSKLHGGGSIRRDHVDRTAPDEANGLVPTQFDETDIFGRFSQRLQRFEVKLDADVKRKDYDDVTAIVNGVYVTNNQDDRDRTEYTYSLRGSYEITSDLDQVFAVLRNNRREYDELQDVIQADRSSDGYEASMGLALDFGGITSGNVSAGYAVQDYIDPFPDIHTPVYGASLNWNATTLTSVTMDIQRSISDAISIYFSGYIATNTRVAVDHELRRNLLLKLAFNYTTDDYEGIGAAERKDSTYDAFVGATYMINRYIYTSIHYNYQQRESSNNFNLPGNPDSYEKNIIYIQLQAQL